MIPMHSKENASPTLRTVAQFAERHPAWTQAGLRNLIYAAEDRVSSRGARIPGNGLAAAGAIVRVGRRVLINEEKFFGWIAEQQRAAQRWRSRSA
ncbi:MAG: hypothetical protein ACT4P4_00810 [Betaproteobacteria bacterium]